VIQASRSLTLIATNLLTDGIAPGLDILTNGDVIGGNIWTVGTNSIGIGLNMPIKPSVGDLLGTTITNYAPVNKNVVNTWAAGDFGVSTAGYSNNAAIGRLILDALGTAPGTQFTFKGVGAGNAIYVDYLELRDGATNRDINGNVNSLAINTNLVIYYARAVINGLDASQKLDHKNNERLRWVSSYMGYFSSTNLIYPDGSTNTFNVGLAGNPQIDSDGDGTPNASDPTPFFIASMINQTGYATNNPNPVMVVIWDTIPLGTNYVLYSTNVGGPFDFNHIAAQFVSPMPYPGPIASVSTNFPQMSPPLYYKVAVYPWLTYPF